MRTRRDIETLMGNGAGFSFAEEITIRLLLDIRDLLSQAKTPEENQNRTTPPRYSPTAYQGSGVSRGDGVQTNNIAI